MVAEDLSFRQRLVQTPKDEILRVVLSAPSLAAAVVAVDPSGSGKNISRRAALLDFLSFHHVGVPKNWDNHRFGNKNNPNGRSRIPDAEIFREGSLVGHSTVREGLRRLGRMEDCEICGISEWMGRPISIQVDHINGVNTDHRLENLQCVCPNCHSQTSTYGGRNKKHPSWDDLYLELDQTMV